MGAEGSKEQQAENPVLEKVDSFLGLSHQPPGPNHNDGGDRDQPRAIGDRKSLAPTPQKDEPGRAQRNHDENHADPDELGGPSRHKVLSEAAHERDRGVDHRDPRDDGEPTEL